MQITDEQYAEIYIAINTAYGQEVRSVRHSQIAGGRAAVEQAAPYLLGEPTDQELSECSACTDECCAPGFRQVFAKRLAQYTAKPDPRREAVLAELEVYFPRVAPDSLKEIADTILAAIDAAGGKQS